MIVVVQDKPAKVLAKSVLGSKSAGISNDLSVSLTDWIRPMELADAVFTLYLAEQVPLPLQVSHV